MKVLIYKSAPLGELILSIPLMKSLYRKGITVHLLTENNYIDFFAKQSFVNQVYGHHTFNGTNKYDVVINLHLTRKKEEKQMIKELFGAEIPRIINICEEKKINPNDLAIDFSDQHFSDYIIDFVSRELLMELDRKENDHFFDQETLKFGIKKNKNAKVAIFPEASQKNKMWALSNYASVIISLYKHIDFEMYLTDYIDFKSTNLSLQHEIVNKIVKVEKNFSNLCNKIGCCDLVVSNDSGPKHLAAALNVKSISIQGHNDTKSWYTLGTENITVSPDKRDRFTTNIEGLDSISPCIIINKILRSLLT